MLSTPAPGSPPPSDCHPKLLEPAIYALRETAIFVGTMAVLSYSLGTYKALRFGLGCGLIASIPLMAVSCKKIDLHLCRLNNTISYTRDGHKERLAWGVLRGVLLMSLTKLFNRDIRSFITGGAAFLWGVGLPALWAKTAVIEHKLYYNDPDLPEQIERAVPYSGRETFASEWVWWLRGL